MRKIPKLDELLKEKTVFILGAGASMDYGFPNWEELKSDMLKMLKGRAGKVLPIEYSEEIKWWIDKLESIEKFSTVDSIANDGPSDRHFDLFRIMVSGIICRYEDLDISSDRNGWIEKLVSKFIQAINEKHREGDYEGINTIFRNTLFVTLNYDRVFGYRFFGIIDKELEKMFNGKQREVKKHLNGLQSFKCIYHPHGVIGSTKGVYYKAHTYYNSSNGLGLEYGDMNGLGKHFDSGRIPFIFPVDDLKGATNPTYNEINLKFQYVKNVICIGISETGLISSRFDNLDKPDSFYYTGKDKVLRNTNFIPLGKRAEELINDL